jgi:hypothetical protein
MNNCTYLKSNVYLYSFANFYQVDHDMKLKKLTLIILNMNISFIESHSPEADTLR